MKIQILGTGCYNCIKLETLIDELINELGKKEVEIVRVSEEQQIRKYMPLDQIPGLVINGDLVSSKTLPDRESLIKWLREV